MQQARPNTARGTLVGWLTAACLLVTAGAAQAQSSPYSIGVSQAFGHDSNLFRTAIAPTPDK